MADTWDTTLGEVVATLGGSILTGPFGTLLKASEYTATGVPVISVSEVGFGRIHLKAHTPRVDPSVTLRLPKFLLQPGDIVFARKGAGTAVERSALVAAHQGGWFLGSECNSGPAPSNLLLGVRFILASNGRPLPLATSERTSGAPCGQMRLHRRPRTSRWSICPPVHRTVRLGRLP